MLASEISVATVGASLAPDTVIVTVIVSVAVPSDTVIVKVSVPEPSCASASVSASVLSMVYVHAPELSTAIEPYVPVASPL